MPPLARGTDTCDLRDSAAYAVHRSAYPHFLALLAELRSLPEWIRNDTFDIPHIDIWLPHYFSNLYVLPPLIDSLPPVDASKVHEVPSCWVRVIVEAPALAREIV